MKIDLQHEMSPHISKVTLELTSDEWYALRTIVYFVCLGSHVPMQAQARKLSSVLEPIKESLS